MDARLCKRGTALRELGEFWGGHCESIRLFDMGSEVWYDSALFGSRFVDNLRSVGMAKIKSSKKRILTNEKRRKRNIAVRSRLRTFHKQALSALDAKDPEKVKSVLPAALSEIDKAASKGVLNKKAAGRMKSRLQHRAAVL